VIKVEKKGKEQDRNSNDIGYIESKLADKGFLEKCRKLTGRELDIVKLVWSGYRMFEIARILEISQRTVEFHRRNIMKKYRVDNTVQMVRIALAKKVIELSEVERG
jgi:DNA-binding CsgD family transcriptional regulator